MYIYLLTFSVHIYIYICISLSLSDPIQRIILFHPDDARELADYIWVRLGALSAAAARGLRNHKYFVPNITKLQGLGFRA